MSDAARRGRRLRSGVKRPVGSRFSEEETVETKCVSAGAEQQSTE